MTAATTSLIALSAPAADATRDFSWHQLNAHAAANWMLSDAYGTTVSVTGFGATTDQFGGKPVRRGNFVTVDVYQGYCDAANNQRVDRSWSGSAPADVLISRDLTAAEWASVTVPVTGFETDTPLIDGSCDAPDWENQSMADVVPSSIDVAAHFSAAGAMVTETSSTRDAYDPYLWVTVSAARARMASDVAKTVSATDPRLAALASMPAPDFAYVGHTVRIETTVTRGPGH